MSTYSHKLCEISEIPPSGGLRVAIPGRKPVAVFRTAEDAFFVVDDLCTHNGASLSKYGEVAGSAVECTWHGCKFNLRDGRVLDGPCARALGVHAFIVREGFLYLDLSPQ